MYSVILMATMTTAPAEAPQFFGVFRRWSCAGCYGYVTCSGCYGCFGGCHGWGVRRTWVSYGCGGCFGGCTGYYRVGCVGYTPVVVHSGPVYAVGDAWGAHYSYSASTPFLPGNPDYKKNPVEPPKKKAETDDSLEGTARVILDVPSDAKVFIDGQPTKSGSEYRQFYTPKLEEKNTYFYDVRVETTKNNKVSTEERRIYVRANQVVRESFPGTPTSGSIAQK